jgi:predicted RNA methylase
MDEGRMRSFQRAIGQVVRPEMRVLDLGAGTGALSYFAARRGATVTAVECEPQVFATAQIALQSSVGAAVRVVHADARDYLPDQPVDVVLCEMLHVGLLRERQIEVIDSFKKRYQAHFGGPLPLFLPAACVQLVQPVEHDFTYFGYTVATPVFQAPVAGHPRTIEVAEPRPFQQFSYADPLPAHCAADLTFVAERPGLVNAVRVMTGNVLSDTVDWFLNYLVVPLTTPVRVAAGDAIRTRFRYRPGAEIADLAAGLEVTVPA